MFSTTLTWHASCSTEQCAQKRGTLLGRRTLSLRYSEASRHASIVVTHGVRLILRRGQMHRRGWPAGRCTAVAGPLADASPWLARWQTHRRSRSGTHHPASFKPGLGGPPNTFAHDASASGPVVHAGMRRECGVGDFARRSGSFPQASRRFATLYGCHDRPPCYPNTFVLEVEFG